MTTCICRQHRWLALAGLLCLTRWLPGGYDERDDFAAVRVGAAVSALRNGNERSRAWALTQLRELGPRAEAAVPALIDVLRDDKANIREEAASILAGIGPPAVPALGRALGDTDRRVRVGAVDTLGRMGAAARPAVPRLLERLRDPDNELRRDVLLVLGASGDERVVPDLVKVLRRDADIEARVRAASALSFFGPAAKEAAPALAEVHREAGRKSRALESMPGALRNVSPEKGLLYATGEALQDIGSAAVPTILTLLHDPDKDEGVTALGMLGNMGAEARAAVPELLKTLQAPDEDLRSHAAAALGYIGIGRKQVLAGLRRAVQDRSGSVRLRAATALQRLDPGNPEGLPTLAKALRDRDRAMRYFAVMELSDLGADAAGAVPALVRAVNEDTDVSHQAIEVLRCIGPRAAAAVPALVRALTDAKEDIRSAAAQALTRVQDKGAAVPGLVEALKDPSANVRAHAAEALGGHGQWAQTALPALTKALKDRDDWVRRQAAEALSKIPGGQKRDIR